MFPILQVGPLAVRVPGLILLAGVWVGVSLVEREAPRHKLSAGVLTNMIFYALVAGILGARLWYALRFFNIYVEDPLALLSVNPSTLAPLEGALTGALTAVIYTQRKSLPLWPTLDTLAPALAAFAAFVGLAHLSSGGAFGAPSAVPWAIELWGELRHPAQIYEILAAVIVLAIAWRLKDRAPFTGFTFLAWLGLAAAARLFLEAFRGDSVVIFGSLRSAQLASLAVLGASMAGLHALARGGTRDGRPETEDG
jgi:phosphatidylglycerol:prolipoprotein diacylglycerol transferase